jgi:hypothetical protein
LNLEVGLAAEGGNDPRIEVIQVNQKEQRFVLDVAAEPRSVVLDPNTWALVRATFERRD